MNVNHNLDDLERILEQELIKAIDKSLIEAPYNPTRFKYMLNEYGTLQTCKKLLHEPKLHYGFVILWELKRLDLSVENIILKSPWNRLFTDEEKAIARKKLISCGFNPDR